MIGKYGNPHAIVAWAVSVGRIPASDAALWLTRVDGDGSQAWCEMLLYGDLAASVSLPR